MASRKRISIPTGRPLIEYNNRRNRRNTNRSRDDHSDIPIARCILAVGGCRNTLDDLDLNYSAGTIDDNRLASQGCSQSTLSKYDVDGDRGVQPYRWSVNPALPNGLQFNVVSSGTISGTPLPGADGTTNHTFTVTDSMSPFNQTDNQQLSLTINLTVPPLTITFPAGNTLPNGRVGQLYSQTLLASGGTHSYTWSVAPDLPAWLQLDESTGSLTGTPTTTSNFSRIYTVRDSTLPTNLTVSRSISLRIRS